MASIRRLFGGPFDIGNMCAGAQNQNRSAQDYVQLITSAWFRSLDSIFEVCQLCAEADENLDGAERQAMVASLPFDRTQFVKLAKIGCTLRLRDPKILPLLPPHHTILYELAGLNDEELTAAAESGIVHPKMSRRSLIGWINARRRRDQSGDYQPDTRPEPVFAVLRGRFEDVSDEAGRQFNEELESLCDSFGVHVAFPQAEAEIEVEDRETNRTNRRIDAFLRRAARKMIRQAKQSALKGKPRHMSNDEWLKQQSAYSTHEIEIGPTADLPHIRNVYHRLGKDEEFEATLAAAYVRVRAEFANELTGRLQ